MALADAPGCPEPIDYPDPTNLGDPRAFYRLWNVIMSMLSFVVSKMDATAASSRVKQDIQIKSV
jgi:hypothetical protein